MATIPDTIREVKTDLEMEQKAGGGSGALTILRYQEAVYRLGVIETFSFICKACPATKDPDAIQEQLGAVHRVLNQLAVERRWKLPARDEENVEMIRGHFIQAAREGLARFTGYDPQDGNQFRKDIKALLQKVLIAWNQYRDMLCPLFPEEEE